MSQTAKADPLRCWMRIGGHDVEVRVGRTLLGRHDSCQVVLDDPLASRRHAAVQFDGHHATVQDLGSVNGVLVNGERIVESAQLNNGDEVRLGNQVILIYLGPAVGDDQRRRWGAETLTAQASARLLEAEVEEATVVRDGDALDTLAILADKMLAVGRGADAEKIVKTALLDVRARAEDGAQLDAATLELAASTAVRLAEATRQGKWVDYTFELYQVTAQLLPAPVIDRLYSAVRVADGVSISTVRQYVDGVRRRQASLGPAERFLFRRLEGLEQLAALS